MLPFGSQRSMPVVKGSGFFRAHFSAAVGDLNNTKSVGFTLEGDRTREVYRFLKRTVPKKRLNFLAVAQENGLISSNFLSTRCAGFSLVCSKIDPGSFSHGVSFNSTQLGVVSFPGSSTSKDVVGYSFRSGSPFSALQNRRAEDDTIIRLWGATGSRRDAHAGHRDRSHKPRLIYTCLTRSPAPGRIQRWVTTWGLAFRLLSRKQRGNFYKRAGSPRARGGRQPKS